MYHICATHSGDNFVIDYSISTKSKPNSKMLFKCLSGATMVSNTLIKTGGRKSRDILPLIGLFIRIVYT